MTRLLPTLAMLVSLAGCALHVQPKEDPALAVNRGLASVIHISEGQTVRVPLTYPARLVIDNLTLKADRNELVPAPTRFVWQRAPYGADGKRPPVRVEDVFLVRALAAAAVHDNDDTDAGYAAAVDALKTLDESHFRDRVDGDLVGCALDALSVDWSSRIVTPPDYRAEAIKRVVQLAAPIVSPWRQPVLTTKLPRPRAASALANDAYPTCDDAISAQVFGQANPAFSDAKLPFRTDNYRRYRDIRAEDAIVELRVEFPVRISDTMSDTWVTAGATVADLERSERCDVESLRREARFLPKLADDETCKGISDGRFAIRFSDSSCSLTPSVILPTTAKGDVMLAPGDVVRFAESCRRAPRPVTVADAPAERRP